MSRKMDAFNLRNVDSPNRLHKSLSMFLELLLLSHINYEHFSYIQHSSICWLTSWSKRLIGRFDLCHSMTKLTKWHVHPAKTQISLDIHPVWSESSMCVQWVAKGPSFLHADSEDSDQSGRLPRLIWVFAGRTSHFVGFVMMQLTYFNTLSRISEWQKLY